MSNDKGLSTNLHESTRKEEMKMSIGYAKRSESHWGSRGWVSASDNNGEPTRPGSVASPPKKCQHERDGHEEHPERDCHEAILCESSILRFEWSGQGGAKVQEAPMLSAMVRPDAAPSGVAAHSVPPDLARIWGDRESLCDGDAAVPGLEDEALLRQDSDDGVSAIAPRPQGQESEQQKPKPIGCRSESPPCRASLKR